MMNQLLFESGFEFHPVHIGMPPLFKFSNLRSVWFKVRELVNDSRINQKPPQP